MRGANYISKQKLALPIAASCVLGEFYGEDGHVVGRAELFNVDHADIDAYGEEVCLAQKIAKISQFAPVFGVETVVKLQPEAARRAVGIFS